MHSFYIVSNICKIYGSILFFSSAAALCNLVGLKNVCLSVHHSEIRREKNLLFTVYGATFGYECFWFFFYIFLPNALLYMYDYAKEQNVCFKAILQHMQ